MSHYDDIYLHDTAHEEASIKQERIDVRLAELLADRDAVLASDAWGEVETALADLHTLDPDKLIGSDVLTELYRLAKQEHANRITALTEIAEADVAEAAAFRPDMEDAA